MSDYSKRHFELKGKRAEDALKEIAHRSFLREWCYSNPRWPDGKEICDLLVAFDENLLLFQVKDVAFTGDDERYVREAIDKPVAQALGAERLLRLKGETPPIESATGFRDVIRMSAFRNVHNIVVTLGESEISLPSLQLIREKLVHVFDRDINLIMNELDTISDFTDFIRAKEKLALRERPIHVVGNDIDFLADYLYYGRSFDHLSSTDHVIYDTGIFQEVTNKPEFKQRKLAEKQSYLWDHFVDLGSTAIEEDYRRVSKEMSRLTRLERRMAVEAFLDAADVSATSANGFNRYYYEKGSSLAFVFAFAPKSVSREVRKEKLKVACFIARDRLSHVKKVLGISTECGFPRQSLCEFVLLDAETWSMDQHKEAEKLRRDTGLFTRVREYHETTHEYPGTTSRDQLLPQYPERSRGFIRKFGHKIGRNESCPCGSGKKYKRCCGL